MAISGDGADELFGSYLTHRLAWPIYHYLNLKAQGKDRFESFTQEELALLRPFDTAEQFEFLRRVAHPDQAVWRVSLGVFDETAKRHLLSPDFLRMIGDADTTELYRRYLAQGTARDPLNSVLEVDQHELLPNNCLAFVDRLSMHHSIEVRCPFLDRRIIELASRMPGEMKIKKGINKYVHKLAVQNLLPASFLDRPKEGFVQPNYTWMNTSLKQWVFDTLSPIRLDRHQLFNSDYVQELLRQHYQGKADYPAQIWNLVCFQLWWESCM